MKSSKITEREIGEIQMSIAAKIQERQSDMEIAVANLKSGFINVRSVRIRNYNMSNLFDELGIGGLKTYYYNMVAQRTGYTNKNDKYERLRSALN